MPDNFGKYSNGHSPISGSLVRFRRGRRRIQRVSAIFEVDADRLSFKVTIETINFAAANRLPFATRSEAVLSEQPR